MNRPALLWLALAGCAQDSAEPDTDSTPVETHDEVEDTAEDTSLVVDTPADSPSDTDCQAPLLGVSPPRLQVAEDASADHLVGALSIAGDATAVRLVDDADGRFWLDVSTWSIRVGGALDHESDPEVPLQIELTAPCNVAERFDVTVDVTNVNEGPFNVSFHANPLPETLTGQAGYGFAEDPEGDRITWALETEDDRIRLAHSRVIVDSSIDFETTPRVPIVLIAMDPQGLQARIHAEVIIEDVDEAPVSSMTTLLVAEQTLPTQPAGQLQAQDPEGLPLTWALRQPNPYFTLTAHGEIYLTDVPDFEHPQRLGGIMAVATDPGGNSTWVDAQIEIYDINEAPQTVARTWTFPEGLSRTGTRLEASDVDAGDAVVFSDVSDPRFTVSADGWLSTGNEPFDHEATPEIALTYQVTDRDGLSTEGEVLVIIEDVDEGPRFTDVALTVDEGLPPGTVVATLEAVDPEGDPIVWHLPNPQTFFSITEDGQLTTLDTLDFETRPEHVFLVSASGPDWHDPGYAFVRVSLRDLPE